MKHNKVKQITVQSNSDVDNQNGDGTDNAILIKPLAFLKNQLDPAFNNRFRLLEDCSNVSLYRTTELDTEKKARQHYLSFKNSMRLLLICGQIVGLLPVLGVSEDNATKVRFNIYSWKSLCSYVLCAFQGAATMLCLFKLFKTTVSISILGTPVSAFLSFYGTTWITTILFLKIAYKWPKLMQELASTPLDEYVDPKLKMKCNAAVILFIILSITEHILSLIARITEASLCYTEQDVFEKYIEIICPWLLGLGIPYNGFSGILLEGLNFICSLNWNYSDLFIVCMSIYLTSMLEGVNKKIMMTRGKYLPSAFWRALREDFNRVTRLVRAIDDVISSVIFMSFASNLFFICLQLFNLLTNGVKDKPSNDCANSETGLFGGYEHGVYFTFSLVFMLVRSLSVALFAANVHSESLVPAPALYEVPSPVYCVEVQRFLEQIHGETVALSGLQFFNVTKGLVLTIAGTIVTYELVLLQFDGEEMLNKN